MSAILVLNTQNANDEQPSVYVLYLYSLYGLHILEGVLSVMVHLDTDIFLFLLSIFLDLIFLFFLFLFYFYFDNEEVCDSGCFFPPTTILSG